MSVLKAALGIGICQMGFFCNFLTSLVFTCAFFPKCVFYIYARDVFLQYKTDEDPEIISCYYTIKNELVSLQGEILTFHLF